MEKTFIGEVCKSAEREFTGKNGDVILMWELTLLLTDDRGINFNISSRDELFETVSMIGVGSRVRVVAEPDVRLDGRVRYKARLVELVEQTA